MHTRKRGGKMCAGLRLQWESESEGWLLTKKQKTKKKNNNTEKKKINKYKTKEILLPINSYYINRPT